MAGTLDAPGLQGIAFRVAIFLFLGFLTLGGSLAVAADFPPISPETRAMTEVEGRPGAIGAYIFRNADLSFRDYPRDPSSRMTVEVRVKILTEEGAKYMGEVSIAHSRQVRLQRFDGRTVTADGREVPLTDDSIFREERSKSDKEYLTKVAFPALEVGAILDYRYVITWDHFYYLEPWYFHAEMPVLTSEIVYHKPDNLGFQLWGRETQSQKFQIERRNEGGGLRLAVKMEDLPAVPDEPYGFPQEFLASRFMVIPTALMSSGTRIPLLDKWATVCEGWWDQMYRPFQRKGGSVAAEAKRIAGSGDKESKIRHLFEYVRDEVASTGESGPWIDTETRAKKVLDSRSGSSAERILLLQEMLRAAKVETHRLWVTSRLEGIPDLQVANPSWFSGMILKVADSETYLDLSDPGLGVGHLPAELEATSAVNCEERKAPIVELPEAPWDSNIQRVALGIVVSTEGELSGSGAWVLEGQNATRFLAWKEAPEETVEAWQERLEERLPSFEISEVKVREDIHARNLKITWALASKEDEVLGDEVSLVPARTLFIDQPFDLAPGDRGGPVQLAFGRAETLDLTLSWPEGWVAESLPQSFTHASTVGAYQVEVEMDEAKRSLKYRRRFERPRHFFPSMEEYKGLRELYEEATKGDRGELVFVAQ